MNTTITGDKIILIYAEKLLSFGTRAWVPSQLYFLQKKGISGGVKDLYIAPFQSFVSRWKTEIMFSVSSVYWEEYKRKQFKKFRFVNVALFRIFLYQII